MNEGIFVAASGGIKQQRILDVLSNNLANINTPGFKKDQMAFEELMPPFKNLNIPSTNPGKFSIFEFQDKSISYVGISGFSTDFSQGVMTNTGNSFDMAIEGDGFFAVKTGEGVRYTRTGNFTLDDQARMVNKQGQPFLDINNKPIFFPPEAGQITIGNDGLVSFNTEGTSQTIAQLKLVHFSEKSQLIKEGNGLYKLSNPEVVEEFPVNIKVFQGFVEASNVNVIEEMVAMIQSVRLFEAYQKLIQSIDEADNQSVNVIARVA